MKVRHPSALVPVVSMVSMLALAPQTRGAVSFEEGRALPLTFPSGGDAYGTATADFNGDGFLDLAVMSIPNIPNVGGREVISILLGDGNGMFQAPFSMQIALLPGGGMAGLSASIIARDFDRDGRIDLVGVEYSARTVVFFKGRGDGTLEAPVSSPLPHRPASGSNYPSPHFALSDYLDYPPPGPALGLRDLSDQEADAILSADPDLEALFESALAQGFVPVEGGAFEVTDPEGERSIRIGMVEPGVEELLSVCRVGDFPYIEEVSRQRYAIRDLTGGLSWDLDLGQSILDGMPLLQRPPGGGGAGGGDCPLTYSNCMWNCLVQALPDWLSFGALKGQIAVTDCAKCFVSGGKDHDACSKCLADLASKVPGLAQGNDARICHKQCKKDPKSHTCENGNVVKCVLGPVGFPYNLGLFGIHYSAWVYNLECIGCIPQKSDYQPCRCDPGDTPVAKYNGPRDHCTCDCIPCQKPGGGGAGGGDGTGDTDACKPIEVRTAHDPNRKIGPQGDVTPGEVLEYQVDYENEGEGTAFAVYVTDRLDEKIDDATLVVEDGGTYLPAIRTIYWEAGDLGPGQGGTVRFRAALDAEAGAGAEVTNVATVVFPSVPEATPTNPVVSVVRPLAAEPQTVETAEGVAVGLTLHGSGPAGRPLTFAIDRGPSSGDLSGEPPDVVYTPSGDFQGADSFTFVVTEGLSVSAPAAVQVVVTSSPADRIPPEVVAVSPLAGETVEAPATGPADGLFLPVVKAYFSEPLDPATVVDGSLVLEAAGVPVSGNVALDATTNRILFLPSEALTRGTEYTAVVTTAVRDLSGNALAGEHSWSFRTFPDGAVQAEPSPLDFGPVAATLTRKVEVRIHSLGAAPVLIQDIHVEGDGAFTVDPGACAGGSVPPSSTCTVTVAFTPGSDSAAAAGSLVIVTDAGTVTVPLGGKGRPLAAGAISFARSVYRVEKTAGAATIDLTRSGGSDGEASIEFETADGTAKAPEDYTAAAGKLVFHNGQSDRSFQVPVAAGAATAGGSLEVELRLQDPAGAALGTSAAILLIYDAGAQGKFIRGDSNCDGTVDISDGVFTLSFLYLGGDPPCCSAPPMPMATEPSRSPTRCGPSTTCSSPATGRPIRSPPAAARTAQATSAPDTIRSPERALHLEDPQPREHGGKGLDRAAAGAAAGGPPRREPGDECRHPQAVGAVLLAVLIQEVALLEPHGDQDVSRQRAAEEEVPGAQGRRGPEGDQPADVERVTHLPVEERHPERQRMVLAADQEAPDLPRPEQIEVIDHQAGERHQQPAGGEQGDERRAAGRRGHVPQDDVDRPPLPDQERHQEVRDPHVSAPLDGRGHHPLPGGLEPRPGHQRMLDSERGDQQQVDRHRLADRAGRPGVDGLRHCQIADESGQVGEHPQECRVPRDAVDEEQ
jgi:Big-like domain-containing protein/Calx-beta domain-containing protein